MTLLEIINVIIEMSTILIYCDGAFERRSMAIGKKIALFIGGGHSLLLYVYAVFTQFC